MKTNHGKGGGLNFLHRKKKRRGIRECHTMLTVGGKKAPERRGNCFRPIQSSRKREGEEQLFTCRKKRRGPSSQKKGEGGEIALLYTSW